MPKFERGEDFHKTNPGEIYFFYCPGCQFRHFVRVSGGPPVWSWNRDQDKPTVTPSIVVDVDGKGGTCHFFINDGQIRFLDDCWHALKGQTVELPDRET